MKIIITLILAINCLLAISTNEMSKYTKEELLEKSFNSPSANIKVSIRSYLAKKYTQSKEGLFSRAYLADYNGDNNLSAKLYGQCDSVYCKYNDFVSNVNKENVYVKIKEFDKLLKDNAEFINYELIRVGYFNVLDNIEDKKERRRLKKEYLTKWEKELGEELYIFDFIRGIDEENTFNNYEKAKNYYLDALVKKGGNKNFEVLRRYVDVLNNKLFDASTMRESDRTDNLIFMENFLLQDVLSQRHLPLDKLITLPEEERIYAYQVYQYMASYTVERNEHEYALGYYLDAFMYYKTAEILDLSVGKIGFLYGEGKVLEFLNKSKKYFIGNYDVYKQLAVSNQLKNNLEEAEKFFKMSVKRAPTVRDKWNVTVSYVRLLEDYLGKYDDAYALYKPFLKTYPANSSTIHSYMLENRVSALDFKNLEKHAKATTFQPEKELAYAQAFKAREKEKKEGTPENASHGKLDASWFTLSGDGKYFVAGWQPAELWDFKKMRKIKNISETDIGSLRKVSPSNQYVAMLHNVTKEVRKATLVIYDLKTKSMLHQILLPFEYVGEILFDWSPSSNEIIFINEKSHLMKYDVQENKITQVINKDNTYHGDLKWSKDGKYIFVMERLSRNGDGKIEVYDAKTLVKVRRLTQVNWPHAIGVTHNGKYLVCVDNRRKLHRWDLHNDFEHEDMRVRVISNTIVSHPSKSEVIINDWGGGSRNLGVVVDLEKMQETVGADVGNNEHAKYYYIEDGKKIVHVELGVFSKKDHDTINLYDAKSFTKIITLSNQEKITKELFYAKSTGDIVITDNIGVHVWDTVNGTKKQSWNLENAYKVLQLKENSDILIVLLKDEKEKITKVVKLNVKEMTTQFIGILDIKVQEWGVVDNYLFVSGIGFFGNDVHSGKGYLGLYDLNSFELLKRAEIDIVTQTREYPRLFDTGFSIARVSKNKNSVAVVTHWQDGFGKKRERSQFLRIFDFSSSYALRKMKITDSIKHVEFKDNENIEIGGYVHNIRNGENTEIKEKSPSYISSFDNANGVDELIIKEKNLKISLNKEGNIEVYDTKKKKEILTIRQ